MANEDTVQLAIQGALEGQRQWEEMPWNDRAAIFLKAADLISGKYREKILAATILGQGKNAWQAEIDAAAEVRISPFPFLSLINDYEIALRFPSLRCEICGRIIRSTTADEFPIHLE